MPLDIDDIRDIRRMRDEWVGDVELIKVRLSSLIGLIEKIDDRLDKATNECEGIYRCHVCREAGENYIADGEAGHICTTCSSKRKESADATR